jgi:D-aminopeptidase
VPLVSADRTVTLEGCSIVNTHHMQASKRFIIVTSGLICLCTPMLSGQESGHNRPRAREAGLVVGQLSPGPFNAITDVAGVTVGHRTLVRGDSIRTGVTTILPHSGNIFQEKVPGAIEVFNGFGKLAGYTQVRELGTIETPVILTNTLSVPVAANALIRYTLDQEGNETVRSVNPVIGETNDGWLNDIRGQHVSEEDVLDAIRHARTGEVEEGSVGAGTGTMALGFKGGIGTASRLTGSIGGSVYTVGVLVQSNFGRELIIKGTVLRPQSSPAALSGEQYDPEGSCMIVVATDAPVSARNLRRMARRSFNGMARTCTYMSNGSGDYCIAFSTAYRIPHSGSSHFPVPDLLDNKAMNPLFRAVEEATQEAIYNSLFTATTVKGRDGHTGKALDPDQLMNMPGK